MVAATNIMTAPHAHTAGCCLLLTSSPARASLSEPRAAEPKILQFSGANFLPLFFVSFGHILKEVALSAVIGGAAPALC